jgi:tetratricopeptide (TPR) repeat protein
LAFQGRIDEAIKLYSRYEAEITETIKIEIRFFLAVGSARISDYKASRSYLGANLRLLKSELSSRSLFFIHQGIGFYRFFGGRLNQALKYAELAYEYSNEAQFLYGRVLSSDLRGHCFIKTGKIHKGIKTLKQAKDLSLSLGVGGASEALDISLAIYHAQFDSKALKTINKLTKLISESTKQDSYSLSLLYLELSRVYTLKGQIEKAKEALNEACQIIYSTKNYRHEIEFNVRYAYIYFLEGEYHQALNLLGNARRNLDQEVDKLLELPLLGMEIKILTALKLEEDCLQKKTELSLLTNLTGDLINKRILMREDVLGPEPYRLGEDQIGDLLDLIKNKKKDAPQKILESGYLGLFRRVIETKPGEILIYLDLVPGSIIMAQNGSIDFIPMGLTKIFRKLIRVLAEGSQTKEAIIKEVWGYEYDPILHDSLIYTNVMRLRRLFGRYEKIIEVTESSYGFLSSVRIEYGARNIEVKKISNQHSLTQNYKDLNYRQLQMLDYLTDNKFMDVRSYKKIFQVSDITASRDLSTLAKLAFVRRVGRGRATKYTRVY